jgi:hypothetical protein
MPNATIASVSTDESGNFNAQSLRETQQANPTMYVDPNQFRKPDFFVYVYSVVDPRPAGKKLTRSLPPLIPNIEIAEIKPGSRYVLVTKIASPVNQPLMRENGESYIDLHDARRVAMDIVNPENLSLDQDRKTTGVLRAEGNDYGKLGVFWSLTNPPTEEEIASAIARKEAFYQARLEQARVIEMSNPKGLDEYLTTNDHVAAEYFGLEFAWHKQFTRPATCPICGDAIKEGVAYHKNADGLICVLDWKRTVDAGVKTRVQVPHDKRWWVTDQSSRSGEPAAS